MYRYTLLVLAIICAFSANAKKKSVNPKYLTQNLHYLHKSIDISPGFDEVFLTGPEHIVFNRYDEHGKKTSLNMDEYLKQLIWSQSVFAARTGSGYGNGTAFYVGGDLVLTNKHVAETDHISKSCGFFNIKVEIPFSETVRCRKVHYCSPKFDFCLVEMFKLKNGDSLSDHLSPLVLADTHGVDNIDEVYAIGNAVGYGIQGSKGQGLYRNTANGEVDFVHFSPTFGGSSGSPLINEAGKVVGINYAGNVLFPSGYNIQESTLFTKLRSSRRYND